MLVVKVDIVGLKCSEGLVELLNDIGRFAPRFRAVSTWTEILGTKLGS